MRPSTRAKVLRAIEELGYLPSVAAQSLRSKRTLSLALVVPDITNAFWTTVVRGVEDVAQRHGYSALLCNTDENLVKQHQYLDLVIRRQVDGVIVAPYDADVRNLDRLRDRNIPAVLIGRRIRGWEGDSVLGDGVSGTLALVRHLIQLGHQRVAMLSGPAASSTTQDRFLGCCLALEEAGIAVEPELVKCGEFKEASGQELTRQLLDSGLRPTAICAANNSLAMGVIAALGSAGLRIPQDMALVSFDDLLNTSRIFPFLTVVSQPAYEMGVNAAQLLFSRLDADQSLPSRNVVLPTRLIVRHSCGSQLGAGDGQDALSLPISDPAQGQSQLVKPLKPEEQDRLALSVGGVVASILGEAPWSSAADQPDQARLSKALRFKEPDRVPLVELQAASRKICEHVLGHELHAGPLASRPGPAPVTPEEHIEYAVRLGVDAVPCHYFWEPGGADAGSLEPSPSIASHLSYLERYLSAAQGTGVGVMPSFSSFFGLALRALGLTQEPQRMAEVQPRLEALMDAILLHLQRVMRVICDRFGDELALVVIHDKLADQSGLAFPAERFEPLFRPRMQKLVAPALDYDRLLLLSSRGRLDAALPIVQTLGFHGVSPVDHSCSDIRALKKEWAGKLAFVGSISIDLLRAGSEGGINAAVQESCINLAPGGGFILGSSGTITDETPPESVVTLARAVQKFGRYGSLGREV